MGYSNKITKYRDPSQAAAITDIADGYFLASTLLAAGHRPRLLGQDLPGDRPRGLLIYPYLNGDNLTATVSLHICRGVQGRNEYLVQKIQSFALTASTKTGVADGLITTADFLCDTIVATPSALLGVIQSVYATSDAVHSPADNTPGVIFCPFLADCDAIILNATTLPSGTTFNALVEAVG